MQTEACAVCSQAGKAFNWANRWLNRRGGRYSRSAPTFGQCFSSGDRPGMALRSIVAARESEPQTIPDSSFFFRLFFLLPLRSPLHSFYVSISASMSQRTLVHSLLRRPPAVVFQPHFLDGRLHNAPFAHNYPTAARRPLFRTHTVSHISLVFATATRHHVSIPDFFWSSPNVDRVHTACSTMLLKSAFHCTTFAHVRSVVLTQFAPSPP